MTSDGTDLPPPAARQSEISTEDAGPRVWQSEEILKGSELVLIEHRGEIYQLRVTRQRKLILNK